MRINSREEWREKHEERWGKDNRFVYEREACTRHWDAAHSTKSKRNFGYCGIRNARISGFFDSLFRFVQLEVYIEPNVHGDMWELSVFRLLRLLDISLSSILEESRSFRKTYWTFEVREKKRSGSCCTAMFPKKISFVRVPCATASKGKLALSFIPRSYDRDARKFLALSFASLASSNSLSFPLLSSRICYESKGSSSLFAVRTCRADKFVLFISFRSWIFLRVHLSAYLYFKSMKMCTLLG